MFSHNGPYLYIVDHVLFLLAHKLANGANRVEAGVCGSVEMNNYFLALERLGQPPYVHTELPVVHLRRNPASIWRGAAS